MTTWRDSILSLAGSTPIKSVAAIALCVALSACGRSPEQVRLDDCLWYAENPLDAVALTAQATAAHANGNEVAARNYESRIEWRRETIAEKCTP